MARELKFATVEKYRNIDPKKTLLILRLSSRFTGIFAGAWIQIRDPREISAHLGPVNPEIKTCYANLKSTIGSGKFKHQGGLNGLSVGYQRTTEPFRSANIISALSRPYQSSTYPLLSSKRVDFFRPCTWEDTECRAIKASGKKDFKPLEWRNEERNQVTGVFNKIRRSLRRVKWKYARSVEGFCGRERSFPVCKMGVRLDNDGIHPPTLSTTAGGWGVDSWREAEQRATGMMRKKFSSLFFSSFLSLLFLPSAWTCIVIKKARGGLAIRYRGRFFQGSLLEGNFPRGQPISSRLIWEKLGIYEQTSLYPPFPAVLATRFFLNHLLLLWFWLQEFRGGWVLFLEERKGVFGYTFAKYLGVLAVVIYSTCCQDIDGRL